MPALLYNPDKEYVRFITRWRHTLLPMVVEDPLFWFLITSHVVLLIWQRSLVLAGSEGLAPLNWEAALVPTSLLTFFVVFYVSNCYARFFQLFGCCVGIAGCMAEWAYLVRTHFGDYDADVRWNMMRVMLAAMQIHYAFVAGDDSDHSDGQKEIDEGEWAKIVRRGFLSAAEVKQLRSSVHNARFFLPVQWALQEVKLSLLGRLRTQQKSQQLGMSDLMCQPGLMAVYGSFESVALTFRRSTWLGRATPNDFDELRPLCVVRFIHACRRLN